MPATTTRRRAPSRAGKRKSRKPAPKRRPAAKPTSTEPGVVARSRAAAGRQLDGHWGDVGAVALLVLGVLCVLGLTSDLAGPVGTGLADGTGAVFGRGRVAVPIACFGFAILLLWPRRLAFRDAADTGPDARADGPAAAETPTEVP